MFIVFLVQTHLNDFKFLSLSYYWKLFIFKLVMLIFNLSAEDEKVELQQFWGTFI